MREKQLVGEDDRREDKIEHIAFRFFLPALFIYILLVFFRGGQIEVKPADELFIILQLWFVDGERFF